MRDLIPGIVTLVVLSTAVGCFEESRDFPEEDELLDLRVLGIRAEPADVVPGETVELTPLLYVPPGEEVSYRWELCVVTQGPDEAYACDNEALGLPDELLALFDLGTEPTAEVSYFIDAQELQAQCNEALEELEVVEDYVTLPDCDAGFELTVRLVTQTDETERIAIRGLFFWFEDPLPEQRNLNPEVSALRMNNRVVDVDTLAAAPNGQLDVQVLVDESYRESFVPRSDPEAEPREEALVFSWFSTHGRWNRERSFADGVNFDLDEAGRNLLEFNDRNFDESVGADGEFVVVVRDRRGGVGWMRQGIRVMEPSGGVTFDD